MTVTPAPTGTQRNAKMKIAIAGTGFVGLSNAVQTKVSYGKK